MGLLDSLRKTREEKKQKENPTTPPPAGHTLAEVMQDKKKFHLLGELLKKNDHADLAARLFAGKLEEGDIDLLEGQREILSDKIIRSEKIEKLLTKENVIEIARNNPEFEKIINQLGPEKAIRAITSQLKEISITEPDRFKTMSELMEAKDSYRNKEYKEVNDKIEKLLADSKITQKEYLDVLAIENPDEKDKALKKLSKRTYGDFKRVINFLRPGWKWAQDKTNTLENLREAETSLEDSLANLNTQNESIGYALYASINENGNIRKAFANELINEKPPEEPKHGLREAKKKAMIDEKKFNRDWERFKRDTDYINFPDQQEQGRKTFIAEQKEANKKKIQGEGFWHTIILAVAEAFLDDKESKLE
jgi:hypothetical protein